MRLSLKKFEQAKKEVMKGKEAEKIVKDWQDAIKKIGNNGNGRVTVIIIDDDGTLTWECELDETASRPILKADEEKSPFEKAGKK